LMISKPSLGIINLHVCSTMQTWSSLCLDQITIHLHVAIVRSALTYWPTMGLVSESLLLFHFDSLGTRVNHIMSFRMASHYSFFFWKGISLTSHYNLSYQKTTNQASWKTSPHVLAPRHICWHMTSIGFCLDCNSSSEFEHDIYMVSDKAFLTNDIARKRGL
jgi:hypothetical protein